MTKTPGDKPTVWQEHGWKIFYFAAGILFIGFSKMFVPFAVRISILVFWALGLTFILLTTMNNNK